MTHKDKINYSYLFKANYALRQKIDKMNYKFISYIIDKDYNDMSDDEKIKLFEKLSSKRAKMYDNEGKNIFNM